MRCWGGQVSPQGGCSCWGGGTPKPTLRELPRSARPAPSLPQPAAERWHRAAAPNSSAFVLAAARARVPAEAAGSAGAGPAPSVLPDARWPWQPSPGDGAFTACQPGGEGRRAMEGLPARSPRRPCADAACAARLGHWCWSRQAAASPPVMAPANTGSGVLQGWERGEQPPPLPVPPSPSASQPCLLGARGWDAAGFLSRSARPAPCCSVLGAGSLVAVSGQ